MLGEPITLAGARHIGIIMDGNGRWAKSRGLPRVAGHRAGIEAVRRTLDAIASLNAAAGANATTPITHLTLYGFSAENWGRPEAEVQDLMGLLRYYLEHELAALHGRGVRLRVIGERARFAPDLAAQLKAAEIKTQENKQLNLTLALSYGSRQEIIEALRAFIKKGGKAEDLNELELAKFLYTHDLPDPDLIIRTSGEQRLSNFLLWQAAYAELYFTETLWPDFAAADLAAALQEFNRRDRRFGVAGG